MKKEKQPKKEINYFIEDANLFTLWVYSRPDFYPRKYFGIGEITPLKDSNYQRVFNFLKTRLKISTVPFKSFSSYSDNVYADIKMPPALTDERLKGYSEESKKKIIESSKKFQDNDFDLEDIEVLTPIFYSLHSLFCLQPDISQDDVVKLKKHMDEYIEMFLNNELFVYDRNYFNFEKQKQLFIEKVRKMSALENYGSNFVVFETKKSGLASRSEDGFLFIHTLYALQKLGYIGVMRLWHTQGIDDYTYYASIVVFNNFIEEINSSYRKDNPKNIFEKFDAKRGVLKFAGKEIDLAKKGKETDAVLLLKTLLKVKNDDWKHNDEILADWGYNDDDQKDTPKNKVYFAGQKINNAVALKTQIDDFVECNTTKARINPKYRKVDE